jgi:hypothetical protein
MENTMSEPGGLKSTRELLRYLSRRIPPPVGQHHALMLPEDDRGGLVLALRIDGAGSILCLDDADLVRDPAILVEEIVALCTAAQKP